jgi:3-deoxy-manno-octulosonate cytidylyltransferase (CMP-KDO synthetase)
VEQHGKNPQQNVYAIIPARYASVRLEGKLLLPVAGKPLILHTLAQAEKARTVSRVIVATDDERIRQIVAEAGGEAILTSPDHRSGSDRIAEVARELPENSIIVNVQGDEPLISPATIDSAVEALLEDASVDISTTCETITNQKDVLNPDIVKVVCDEQGFALYFSRSPVPYPRDAVREYGDLETALHGDPRLAGLYRKHTGLYVFRREYLLRFTEMSQTVLERAEMLEQLRALENGARIKVVETKESSIGVDTAEDLERVRAAVEKI